MNDMQASNASLTKSSQCPWHANLGGSHANAGHKKKKLPTPSLSQAASAVISVSHVNPIGSAGPSALPSVAAEPSRVPTVGFFTPWLRMHLGQPAVPIGQFNDTNITHWMNETEFSCQQQPTCSFKMSSPLYVIMWHDEHADIATGTHFIDDSFSDEILDSTEDAAAVAEVETNHLRFKLSQLSPCCTSRYQETNWLTQPTRLLPMRWLLSLNQTCHLHTAWCCFEGATTWLSLCSRYFCLASSLSAWCTWPFQMYLWWSSNKKWYDACSY